MQKDGNGRSLHRVVVAATRWVVIEVEAAGKREAKFEAEDQVLTHPEKFSWELYDFDSKVLEHEPG